MKHWTDEELGTLLQESMRSKEPLARDDVARRIASEARPAHRRWPMELAVVAAVLVVVVGGMYVALRAKDTAGKESFAGPIASVPVSSPTSVAPSASLTTVQHKEMAVAAADAAVAAFQPPPGSTKIDGRPQGWNGKLREIVSYSDPTLTQVAWWRTSLSFADVKLYLDSNTPPGMAFSGSGLVHSSATFPDWYDRLYASVANPNPDAYAPPQLLVTAEALPDGTYLEVAGYTDARFGVPAQFRIEEPIGTVMISTERTTTKNGKPWTTGQQLTPLDQAHFHDQISQLVNAYNALPGSYTVPPMMNRRCAAAVPGYTRVDFYTGTGLIWEVTLPNGCAAQVQVTTNGETLDGTLDPTGWLGTVQDVIAQLPQLIDYPPDSGG